jgi:hypothetical protein
LAPQRYRVQFTIGQDTHDKLRRLQALMCRQIPSGDVAAIFDEAVDLMLDKVEREKLGAKAPGSRRPGTPKGSATYENRIRFKTDERGGREVQVSSREATRPASGDPGATRTDAASGASTDVMSRRPQPPRHIPSRLKQAVWFRDRGQCAFVAETGHRCTQRAFLEIHHIQPYALYGPAAVGNLSLRCRRHNAYEAELVFGTRPGAR